MVRIRTERRLLCFKGDNYLRQPRKRTQEIIHHWVRKKNHVIHKIQFDSASPASFLKQNVRHELKLRDSYLKIYPLDQSTKNLYCGFADNAINITGKLILPIFSNG